MSRPPSALSRHKGVQAFVYPPICCTSTSGISLTLKPNCCSCVSQQLRRLMTQHNMQLHITTMLHSGPLVMSRASQRLQAAQRWLTACPATAYQHGPHKTAVQPAATAAYNSHHSRKIGNGITTCTLCTAYQHMYCKVQQRGGSTMIAWLGGCRKLLRGSPTHIQSLRYGYCIQRVDTA